MTGEAKEYFEYNDAHSDWAFWYIFEKPSIEIVFNERPYDLGPPCTTGHIAPSRQTDERNWYYFNSAQYDLIHWTIYAMDCQHLLAYNGFRVPLDHSSAAKLYSLARYGYYGSIPLISLQARDDAKCPLDLSRKIVSESFQLEESLVLELCKAYVARELESNKYIRKGVQSPKGFIDNSRAWILHVSVPIYIVGTASSAEQTVERYEEHLFVPAFYVKAECKKVRTVLEAVHIDGEGLCLDYDRLDYIWIMNETMKFYKCESSFSSNCKKIEEGVTCYANSRKNIKSAKSLPKGLHITKCVPIILEYSPSSLQPDENNLMLRVLEQYLPCEAVTTHGGEFDGEVNGGNGGWIPYDLEERKRIYPKAFRELARYMK
jgi:hypothetical protein